jgi:CHAT domain-containing protein/Tfp pilus assembly protein PilF
MKRILLFTLILISNLALGQEWLTLYQQSQTDYENDNLEAALKSALKSLSIYEKENERNNSNYCSILRHLSIISYSAGEINSAIRYGKDEIEILRGLDEVDKNTLAGAINNLALFHQTLGEAHEAESLLEEVVEIYSVIENSGNELYIARGMLAISQFGQQKMDEAGDNFRVSIGFFANADDLPFDYLTILLNYGIYLVTKEEFSTALTHLSDAKNYYDQFKMDATPEYVLLLRNLGRAKVNTGDAESATAELERALEISRNLYGQNDPETISIKNELALHYQRLGKTELADALSSDTDITNLDEESKLDYAISQSNLGAIRQSDGDLIKAEELYLEAIEIFSIAEKEVNSYLNALQNLGRLYQTKGEFARAGDQFQKAREIATRTYGESSHFYADALVNIADLYRITNNHTESGQLYLSALNVFESDIDSPQKEIAKAHEGLALHYLSMGNFNKSQENFLSAINIYSNTGDKNKLLTTKSNYAVLKQAMGEYKTAEILLREIYAEVTATRKGTLEESVAAENLGTILIEAAKYAEAEEYFKIVLRIREGYGKSTPEYAKGIINLARLKVREGKYTDAEALYRNALEIYSGSLGNNDLRVANLENNMALMYQYMGNMEAAESLLERSSEKIKNQLGIDHPEYATALENRASLLQILGKREEAMPLLQQALQIDEKTLGRSHPNYAFTLHNLASIYLDEKNYMKAEELFLQSVEIEKSVLGEDHPIYAGTLNNLGVLYEKQENYVKAENYFNLALSIREKVLGKDHPDYAYSQYGLAVLYLKMGKLAEARTLYETAIASYLDQVQNFFPSLSEKEKSDFYTKIKPVIENFKEFAIEYAVNEDGNMSSKLIGEIYNVQLATKALLLNASNKVRNRIASSGDLKLIESFNKWIEIKENLARYYQYNLEQLDAEQVDITKLEEVANQLEKEISLQSQVFASEFDKQPVSWEQIKNKLTDNEAAIEILRVQRNTTTDTVMYVGLVIKKSSDFPKMVIIKYGESLESMMYKFYKNSVTFRAEDPYSYNAFWKDLDTELEGISRVYVSADGVYNKVNLNTLRNSGSGEFILNQYEIILLSNTKELLTDLSSEAFRTATLLGYAQYQSVQPENPQPQGVFQALGSGGWLKEGIPALEGTKKEVESISGLLQSHGWEFKTLETTNASESAVKNLKGQGLIHIATHGFFLEDLKIDESGDGFGVHIKNYELNPLFRSGLLLAGSGETIFGTANQSQQEDGILTAYEVMNLSLENTDLVVLSACETGLGEIRNGEGVYGLQRALIVAGAKGLIMSLWKVNDETTQKLMTYFYQNWLSGKTKLEAFKAAQLSLKNEFNDPYYWGAFVMIGR